MSNTKIGLGQSLNVLLGESVKNNLYKNQKDTTQINQDNVVKLSVHVLRTNKYQPRKIFNDVSISELAESIKTQGIIQPLVVRCLDKDTFEIVAGERRWRAAQLAGLTEVPCLIRQLSDEQAALIAIIENIQREDLNPIEEALSIQRLIKEFKLTQEEVGKILGKARTTVTNLLRLLELSEEVKNCLDSKKIETGHARALLAVEGQDQVKICKIIIRDSLSVRHTEDLIRKLKNNSINSLASSTYVNKNQIKKWKQTLSVRFDNPVSVKVNQNGRGQIIINFETISSLEYFTEMVRFDKKV